MRKNLYNCNTFKKQVAHAQQQGFGLFRQRQKRVELPQKQQNGRDKGQN